MGPLKLYYDFRDLFLAPRLALSGKKIWILILGNLIGFINYWILSYLSIILNNITLPSAIEKYGLYPSLFDNNASWYSWLIYIIGILIWWCCIMISCTAVSRVTLKQLKGNDFFSSNDAWEYVKKHWHAIVFGPFSIFLIIFFFLFFAGIFAFICSMPFLGEFIFVIPYAIYFFGSLFTIYTFFVLIVSLIYSPSIVGIYEEDTMGTVFHSYSITINQAWRIITYNVILIPLLLLSTEIFSWFWVNSINLINLIFSGNWFMGEKLNNITTYASTLIYPNWMQETVYFFRSEITSWFGFNYAFPNLFSNANDSIQSNSLSNIELISGNILSFMYFIIGLSILSYALSLYTVGESLMFIIFKKKSDDDNLLFRKDEDELEEDDDDDGFLFDNEMYDEEE